MQRQRRRRILTVTALAALVGGFAAAPANASAPPPVDPKTLTATPLSPQASPIQAHKSASAQLAQSDPALLARTDTARTTVMIKLDYDAAAAYQGGVDSLAATSPEVTGKKLKKSDKAVSQYLKHVDASAVQSSAAIKKAVPAADVTGVYNVAYGGLSATVPANQAKDLLKVPGVVAVQSDSLEQPMQDVTASGTAAGVESGTAGFIGAKKVWPSLGGRDRAGAGVIVGDLDTGIWPEHPMLADRVPAPPGGPYQCDFGDGSNPALGAPFQCNGKLLGAYAFLDTALALGAAGPGEYCTATECTARDSEGHGTHTATTAVGSHADSAVVLGADRGPIDGMAPGASLIAYRVCVAVGCYQSDSVAAVQQAILDGVDVINFSIGGGAQAYSDPVELAFLDAYAAGISVNASAGNDGPGAATAEHAGPWVTTVGASTSDHAFTSTLTLTSTDGATYSKAGATLTTGVTNAPVVLPTAVPGYTGGALCLTPFAAGSVTGKVVVCERGTNGRIEKGYDASLGGAAGMILYNPTASDVETDNHFLPAIHLDGPNTDLVAFLGAHAGITATWATGQLTAGKADVMTGFSSRGPDGDFVKPDVTAPGVEILAGNTPTPSDPLTSGPSGQLYQAIAGTSMSAPHATGLSVLVRAAHPTWTPGQVKSALMTSSLQDVVNADGSTAGVFDRGAGSIRADRAVAPGITFDVTSDAYAASATDVLHRVDLNLPSVDVNPLPGAIKTTRTLTNVSGAKQSYTVKAVVDGGVTISVEPSSFKLKAGQSQKLKIVIDGTGSAQGWHTGQITLKPGSGVQAVLPVAVNTADAAVTLAQSCTPTTVAKGGTVSCTVTATNHAAVAAPSKISVSTTPGLPIQTVGAPAHRSGSGAAWSGTLTPALAPTITAINAGGSPAGGYLPLSAFGIAPVSGMGDETITNFTTPAFQYGSETYTSLAIDSNGYVVVGGGTASDNDCCSPKIPDPARPNNVLAPFWTDLSLDPSTGGGAVRIGTLTDGTNTWIVVDYNAVQAFGHGPANTFEIWIQTGATEGQWFAYDAVGGAAGQPMAAGAENRDGTSGATLTPASSTDWTIVTAPPTPGGSVTFGYTASGAKPGTATATAQLTSPILRATPEVRTQITVTKK